MNSHFMSACAWWSLLERSRKNESISSMNMIVGCGRFVGACETQSAINGDTVKADSYGAVQPAGSATQAQRHGSFSPAT